MTKPIHVLILTGLVGVGKTKTSDAVSDLLTEKGVTNAVIDLDSLRWAYPRPKDDPFYMRLGFKNLSSIWPNYAEIGIEHLIIPTVIENRAELKGFEKAIPGAVIAVIRLTADIDTIHRRLEAREVGDALARHQQRASDLNEHFDAHEVADTKIGTDGKDINEVAKEVLSAWLGDIRDVGDVVG